ncbi:DUF2057 family protein [Photobacterium japonica]|uniref:YccT family protein n=1 Tax=Photobacterium japonica TaxID=2910235 RepID=UPI003D0A4FEB
MKLRTALLALTACGLSFPSLADVNFALPYQAELVLVNGVEKDGNQPLVLPNGVNQIAFTYRDSLRENGDDYLFTSDVILVKFTAEDSDVKLELPKLRTGMDGKQFNKTPQVTLIDTAGDKIAFKQDKLMKAGLQFGRDYEKEIVTYNASGKIAAVAPIVPVTSPVPAIPQANDGTQPRNVAENMLTYWYEQADEATRARFKAKINQQ